MLQIIFFKHISIKLSEAHGEVSKKRSVPLHSTWVQDEGNKIMKQIRNVGGLDNIVVSFTIYIKMLIKCK